MTYHRVCSKSNTTAATTGAGTVYPARAHEFISGFCGVRVVQSIFFCVVFCRSLFCLFCTFSLDYRIICHSYYGFFLLHWCLQTFYFWKHKIRYMPGILKTWQRQVIAIVSWLWLYHFLNIIMYQSWERAETGWLGNRIVCPSWGDMSIHGLFFQWASTIKIQLSVLV